MCKQIRWPHPNQHTWLIIFGPEKEHDISEFDDITQILNLRNELRYCQERLKRMESHPYVKLGLKINRLVQGLRQRRR